MWEWISESADRVLLSGGHRLAADRERPRAAWLAGANVSPPPCGRKCKLWRDRRRCPAQAGDRVSRDDADERGRCRLEGGIQRQRKLATGDPALDEQDGERDSGEQIKCERWPGALKAGSCRFTRSTGVLPLLRLFTGQAAACVNSERKTRSAGNERRPCPPRDLRG